jgi:hypothetical protein
LDEVDSSTIYRSAVCPGALKLIRKVRASNKLATFDFDIDILRSFAVGNKAVFPYKN